MLRALTSRMPSLCWTVLTSSTTSLFSNEPLASGRRVAMVLEYDGSEYSGWQIQRSASTVQEQLENALSTVAAAPVRVQCAGRTDTGVHATHQVVHFDAPAERSPKAWVMGSNSQLPPSVAVRHAQGVDQDFHARFSAVSRRYRYLVYNAPVRSAVVAGRLTWVRQPLTAELMNDAAQRLLGEQDFSAYRAASCQSSTPMRRMDAISVDRHGPVIVFDIQANAFLHHMVRNLVGTLLQVGRGIQPVTWPAQLLEGRDRTLAADTAAPDGLYLVGVSYPDSLGFAALPPGPPGYGP